MEGGRSIAKSKSHYEGFKKAEGAFEGSFPFIAFFDTYVVVAPAYVEFAKVAGSLQFVYKFRDEWEWGGIFDSDFI